MSSITPSACRLAFIAPPLCGNQTLAKGIAEKFNVPYLPISKILYQQLNENTPYGKEIQQYLNKGVPIPDRLITKITLKTLEKYPEGYLIDRFPLTIQQAEAFHLKFKWPHVIYLSTKNDYDTIISKLAAEITCISCGPLFNQISSPEEMEDICKSCKGTDFIKGSESRKEVAEKCLKAFREKTIPVLNLYEDHECLTRTESGTETVDEIYRRVMEAIESK